jgi:hypothetical protein
LIGSLAEMGPNMREIVIDTEISAVITLAELQTTADEASPDDDRHNDNGVHADRIDNVWGESGHGRSAPLQPRSVYHDHDEGIVV